MPAIRACQRPIRTILVGAVLTVVLFFVFHDDRNANTATAFLPKPLRVVTTTVTRYVHTVQTVTIEPQSPPEARLGKHYYRPDGLLEVNEDGPHPVYELIKRAENDWNEKLQRASRTLEDAVKEYRRRYKRKPPKGFDLWWEYVTEHKVQLPDEYDQIYLDLEPFWGLEPSDLFEIQAELEKKHDSYTLGKANRDDNIDILTYAFSEGRYDQLIKGSKAIIALLREIQHLLPPFRATFTPHDGPNRLSDYGVKQALLEAAAAQTYLERVSLPKTKNLGWISACPPTSLARRIPLNLDLLPSRPTKKTFIHDHTLSMNPCFHPVLFHHHGQFLSHNNGPAPQEVMVPEFSYCSTMLHHNIRVPVPYAWVEDVLPRTHDPEFNDKLDDRLLWRGSNTGIFHSSVSRWENSHRDFLVRFTNERDGMLEVLMPTQKENEKIGKPRRLRKSNINPALFDVAFSGRPISCSPTTCAELELMYPWEPYMGQEEAGNYRYALDVDGNGWSGRFKRLITSNSLIFKSTIYPEWWYTGRIQPWLHYVPIQVDLTDLHDAFMFFRGDANGEGSHEDLARKIATAGREWSKKFWRKEDMIAYYFRLILEYARIMSIDRAAMSYNPHI